MHSLGRCYENTCKAVEVGCEAGYECGCDESDDYQRFSDAIETCVMWKII